MFKEYSEQISKEIKAKLKDFEIKSIDENGTFKVIASDETVDRAGEVIKIEAWDFKNYMKNPIMLFGHDYWNIESVAGKATNIYVEGKKLIVEGVFAGTEKAQMLRQLYDEGIIKTVSVGFIPKERDANNPIVITKAELLEVSFVPVPANPNALSIQKEIFEKMVEIGIVKEEEIQEISLSAGDTLEGQMSTLLKAEYGIVDGQTNLYVYVSSIFVDKFIYNLYGDVGGTEINKYFRRSYSIVEGKVQLEGENTEVKPQTEWVDKTKSMMFTELKNLIETIPSKINGKKEVETSDDKDDLPDDKDKDEKIEMQKEALQKVSKVVSDVLHKIKL